MARHNSRRFRYLVWISVVLEINCDMIYQRFRLIDNHVVDQGSVTETHVVPRYLDCAALCTTDDTCLAASTWTDNGVMTCGLLQNTHVQRLNWLDGGQTVVKKLSKLTLIWS